MIRRKASTAKACVALTIAICGSLALPASAAVVYSNFGSGDSYIQNQGWTLTGRFFNGSDQHGTYNVACSFTPASDYTLDKLELAIMNVKPNVSLNMYLMSDNAGVPGTALEELPITVDVLPIDVPRLIVQASSITHPLMTKGQVYWLAAFPATDTTWSGWYQNSRGATGLAFLNPDYDKVWTYHPYLQGAFRISGTAVPEPSSVLPILCGIGGLGGTLWRRRKYAYRRCCTWEPCSLSGDLSQDARLFLEGRRINLLHLRLHLQQTIPLDAERHQTS